MPAAGPQRRRQRRRQHRAQLSALLGMMATSAIFVACNLVNGSHDRIVASGDSSVISTGGDSGSQQQGQTDGPIGGGDDHTIIDPIIDAGDPDRGPVTVTIPIGTSWASPNGATWAVDAGTTQIVNYQDPGSHAIIVPNPQPNIESDDYTVIASVLCPPVQRYAEFGILARVQANGAGAGLGSKWGQDDTPLAPFMGNFFPPMWNPTREMDGTDAGYQANARFWVKVTARGQTVYGKLWMDGAPEPANIFTISQENGRGVGFYTYGVNGAVLESMKVTVP